MIDFVRSAVGLGIAGFLGCAVGCTQDTQTIPESTTTAHAPGQAVTAISADGVLELAIAAGALGNAGEITIATRRDLAPAGVLGPVYEIKPAGLAFDVPAHLCIELPAGVTASRWALASADAASSRILARPIEGARLRRVCVSLDVLSGPYFGLVALTEDPCSNQACGASCDPCAGAGEAGCDVVQGACNGAGQCAASASCQPDAPPDGWDDAPGVGRVFVVNGFALEPTAGFDLDGACVAPGDCIDNSLGALGELMNDQLRQSILGGEAILLVELAGLTDPFFGDDPSSTVKLYTARDSDDPFFPANNFRVLEGQTTCCEFVIQASSVAGVPPQARSRAPTAISAGILETLSPVPLEIGLALPRTTPGPVANLRLEWAVMEAQLDTNLTEIPEGLIGGAWPLNALASTESPYCRTTNPACPFQFTDATMLDLILALITPNPDIDLDGDGLEQVSDQDGDGRIDRCLDGCIGASCTPAVVPPVVAGQPWTCALAPEMADGFSLTISFTAVAASVTGISPGD